MSLFNNCVLEDEKVKFIFDSALAVLSEIGVECKNEETAKKMREKVPFEYKNGRMHFDRDQIQQFFQMRKPELANYNCDDKLRMGGQWHSWYLCDPLTNTPRGATLKEAIDMARLMETLGSSKNPIPVAPEGIEPAIHTLECERISLLYTKNMGGCLTATDKNDIKAISEMYKVAGRRYLLALEPMISPLRLNSEVVDLYFEWCDCEDIDITIFTPIPMAGATSPLVFPHALVQVLAEALALDFIFYNLSGGKNKEGFSLRLDPFDMRDSNIVFGSPEWCLFKQALVELWCSLIGGSYIQGMFRTNSRVVDAQATMERTASFMWQLSLGIRSFSAVGQLSVDEVFSPVQAILDRELLKYGSRLMRGFNDMWYDKADPIDVIKEGALSHSFLGCDSTVEVFRDAYDFSRLSTAVNCHIWSQNGCVNIEQTAWKEAKKIIDRYEFEIERAQSDEINRIYNLRVKQINK